jgi:hypothetical protein
MTACGVQLVTTVPYPFANVSRYGAVEATSGASCFRALPSLKSRALPRWREGFAAAVPESVPLLGLDHGAGPTVKAVRWPAHVVPGFLPPSRPARKPRARLGRARKDQRADVPPQTLTEFSDAMCAIMRPSSPTTLHALTSFASFVHAVETAREALYV